jgi:small nuclear ribonucleoprotein (snRNP)-like protein
MFAIAVVVAIFAQEPPPTSPAAPSPTPVFDVKPAAALVGHQVVVEKKDGSVVAGTLTEAAPDHIAIVLLGGREVIVTPDVFASIRAAEPAAQVTLTPTVEQDAPSPPTEDKKRWVQEKREAEARGADAEAAEISNAAGLWLTLGGGSTVVGILALGVSIFFVPLPAGLGCIGASCIAITAGGIGFIVGLNKNGDATAKKSEAANLRSEARSMAY